METRKEVYRLVTYRCRSCAEEFTVYIECERDYPFDITRADIQVREHPCAGIQMGVADIIAYQ